MPTRNDWMPVFVVVPCAVTMHAAHPHYKRKVPKGPQVEGTDFHQRIGTAVRLKGGGITIQLTAVPVNGKLFIRSPRSGEYRDPTRRDN